MRQTPQRRSTSHQGHHLRGADRMGGAVAVSGKMHGVGRLESLNGDVYEGEFEHHAYHGLGRFTKRGGDTYLGESAAR